ANADCKKLVKSLPNQNTTLIKMIEACNRIGTGEHKYEAMAAVFAAMKGPTNAGVCYGCDKLGHLKKNCL
ncbi:POK9 protein, partial [Indicator maculatus]|nr:POK9 protein [Indicator maculatus]